MDFFKKIQKLDHFSKKLVVFALIFIFAVPFIFFIGKNFQKRLKGFGKEEFLKTIDIQKIKEKKSELESEFKKLEEIKKSFPVITTTTITTTSTE